MTHSTSHPQPSTLNPQPSSQGNLLGLLTAAFYILFTLLPDSHTAMVEWSWVLFWQVGLICPVLWLLGMVWQQRFYWLGNRLDWVVGFLLLGLLLSTLLSPFPMQARWYGWAALCFLAALYALNSWLEVSHRRIRLLLFQGYLGLAFILVSLLLWSIQTLVPELARLQEFRQLGVSLPFDFAHIELRNGFPIGHQNYVAGYLILILPLLLGLGIVQAGWQRWVWLTGVCLGLVNLYTTSSRGGWLGIALLLAIAVAVLLWRSQLPRRWVGMIGLAGFAVLGLLVLGNNRLRSLVTGLFTGQGEGELAYRLITVTTGWHMGLSHLLTGIGPGNVLLLYQRYRPTWAGREAELHYQLHSTPAQLWAELGLWSVLTAVGAIALLSLLTIRWLRSRNVQTIAPSSTPPILVGCILSGLTAYALFSLTDYQLDNISISGVITIYLAVLATEYRCQSGVRCQVPEGKGIESISHAEPISFEKDQEPEARIQENKDPPAKTSLPIPPSPHPPIPPSPPSLPPLLPLAGLGLLLAILIWLVPIHQAWMLSNQGFLSLSRNDLNAFAQRLTRSHHLAPWEPYYSYQLGWNLGNASLQVSDPKQQQVLLQDGVSWLQRGIQAAPDQEFGYSNLGWLQLSREPKAATHAFVRAAQLVPAKRGAFYGLGLSLLAQGNAEEAIAAISLEALRDPLLITSPMWKLPELQPLYAPVVSRMETQYTTLLEKAKAQNSPLLTSQLHQSRGGLRWWVGDLAGSHADLDTYGTPLSQAVLNLAKGQSLQPPLSEMETTAGGLAIAAWLNPDKRQNLLNQAWIRATRTIPPPEILQQLVESMTRSSTLDQWLKQNAPSRQFRRERTGFGVLSRHADGPAPVDFLTVVENIPMTVFFESLTPSFKYAPELDQLLQLERDTLLKTVS